MADVQRDPRPDPQPPAHAVTCWLVDAADALAGRRVRHAFAGRLRELGYSDDACFCAELAFGEMLGNVVRHAGGTMQILLDASQSDAVVHMMDEGRGFAPDARPAGHTWSESGRGLPLIRAMVDDFTICRRSLGGTHVRAVLPRSARCVRTTSRCASG